MWPSLCHCHISLSGTGEVAASFCLLVGPVLELNNSIQRQPTSAHEYCWMGAKGLRKETCVNIWGVCMRIEREFTWFKKRAWIWNNSLIIIIKLFIILNCLLLLLLLLLTVLLSASKNDNQRCQAPITLLRSSQRWLRQPLRFIHIKLLLLFHYFCSFIHYFLQQESHSVT